MILQGERSRYQTLSKENIAVEDDALWKRFLCVLVFYIGCDLVHMRVYKEQALGQLISTRPFHFSATLRQLN